MQIATNSCDVNCCSMFDSRCQLCVTKHAPEIQLKVSDRSVKPLWKNTKVKRLMMAIGFRQIGPLLNFRSVTSTRWRVLCIVVRVLLNSYDIVLHVIRLNVYLFICPYFRFFQILSIIPYLFLPFNLLPSNLSSITSLTLSRRITS